MQGCAGRYERRQGDLGNHTEFILTEVGVQGVGLGHGVRAGRSGRRGGAGELGGQALNVRRGEGFSQEHLWGPTEQCKQGAEEPFVLERSFRKPV